MRILSWLVTVVVCLAVTGGLAGFKYLQIAEAQAMAASFPPPFSVVTTAAAEQDEWTAIRRLTGTVRTPQFVELAAEATGRVVELPVAAGAVVAEGDVILLAAVDDVVLQVDAGESCRDFPGSGTAFAETFTYSRPVECGATEVVKAGFACKDVAYKCIPC